MKKLLYIHGYRSSSARLQGKNGSPKGSGCSSSKEYLKAAHEASFKNKESILRSEKCGCFSCLNTFPASEAYFVKETDGQETAWCPYCDTDAVLGNASGYPITQEFLKAMQDEWF